MGSHNNGKERENHIPWTAGLVCFYVAQDTVGFLGCKCTLPQISHFSSTNIPKSFSTELLSIHYFITQSILRLLHHHRWGTFHSALLKCNDVHIGPLLKPDKTPLHGILSLKHINCTTHFGAIWEFTKDAQNPTISLIKTLIALVPVQAPEGHQWLLICVWRLNHWWQLSMQPSSNFQIIHKICIFPRLLWGTTSKTLTKRHGRWSKLLSAAFPLPTDTVTSAQKATGLVKHDFSSVKPCLVYIWDNMLAVSIHLCTHMPGRSWQKGCSMIIPWMDRDEDRDETG